MIACIAVYQDYVQNNGSLLFALQERDVDYRFVNAADIISGQLQNFNALIIPGGADLYYCEKLNGAGNTAIRNFVESGGGYLGICAGAYYGCSQLDWDNENISGSRELGFINAVAQGPILSFIENGDIKKSWYGAASMQWNDQIFKTLYAAGPLFKVDDDVDVLATYTGLNAPAVIYKNIGQGRVILSSPHIEVAASHFAAGRYQHLNDSYAHEMAVSQGLQAHEATQKDFFSFVLKKLINKGA